MKLKRKERIDEVPGTCFRIIQNEEKFSYGIDAIFLSEFAGPGNKVVDLGTGTGIIPVRMVGRKEYKKIYGIEIQKDMADMAERSVRLNGLEDKIEIINGDLRYIDRIFKKASIDLVVSNPPYMKVGEGIINEDENRAISRHELMSNIEDIIVASDYLLRPLGKLYMVHRPDRLVDIFYYMRKYNIEPKRIRFVKPNSKKIANLVLIQGVKHGRPELNMENELIVYDEDGNYTKDIKEIYYGGDKNG